MIPARGKLFLRLVETPETLGQGRIVLTPANRDTLVSGQFEVVSLGAPTRCDAWPDCERRHLQLVKVSDGSSGGELPVHDSGIQPGDWVLARHRSLVETHQDGLYCCHQDDVLAILHP